MKAIVFPETFEKAVEILERAQKELEELGYVVSTRKLLDNQYAFGLREEIITGFSLSLRAESKLPNADL